MTVEKKNARLILGTVQLGLPYGIANATGQPDMETALSIVKTAMEGGVAEFDTAQGYGASESVLGQCFERLGCLDEVKVVSKLAMDMDAVSVQALRQSLRSSLNRLRIPRLEGLLLHKEEHLDEWDKGLGQALRTLIEDGLVNNVGISVYSPQAAIRALRAEGLNLVQIPSNLFDRRFERAKVFELAEELGKTLYIRSVFLQGLVFLSSKHTPEHLSFAAPVIKDLEALADRWGLTPHELSLGYARRAYPGTGILFGAETAGQVSDNIKAWETVLTEECVEDIRRTFSNVEEQVLNPVLWS